MPELKCTVETCIHNKQSCCDMNHIEVIGCNKVDNKADTSCSSFRDYAVDSYSNSVKGATLLSDISCDVKNCLYNVTDMCQAGVVEVQGSNACHSGDTECSSFVEKQY